MKKNKERLAVVLNNKHPHKSMVYCDHKPLGYIKSVSIKQDAGETMGLVVFEVYMPYVKVSVK